MQLFDRTLGQWLEHWLKRLPIRIYRIFDRNLRFTWSQLNRRVDDMAKGLLPLVWNVVLMWVSGRLMFPIG